MTLTPAYGRDYKSAKAVKADWAADKDFIIADFGDPFEGKPANRQSFRDQGYRGSVFVRYQRLTKIVEVIV
jgi:hypothetical protein